ncbi:MAG: aspartate kinase [Polaribacter sp.]|nr:aspartate kinase [Polaribacter sp.]
MKVLKFGGSSVANSQNIKKVISIVEATSANQKVVVVVSAMGKTTDNLLEIANLSLIDIQKAISKLKTIQNLHTETLHDLIETDFEKVKIHVDSLFYQLHSIFEGIYLLQELSDKTIAKISSYGELLSSYIIAQAFKQNNDAGYVDSRNLITANKNYLNAQVNFEETNQKIQSYFAERNRKITVCGGFIASNKENETTTLGRGGSDYSAAIYAAALDAEILEIWTDVSGMFTANPKLVKQAKPINEISYEEAMELSHFGAKVLYPPTIAPALQKLIPICIKNTFEPAHEGTLISKETTKECVVKGISHIENISLITLEGSGMIGIPGFSKRLFETLSKNLVNVIFITSV